MAPKKILFCTDFSENSEPARELAVEYAKALGADLNIIHVIDMGWIPSPGGWAGTGIAPILSVLETTAATELESIAKKCSEVVKGVLTYCKVGSVPREIVGFATEQGVDLIVIGTHGRTGVKHLIMGSVARSVLRMAHRPVLIVEAPLGKGETVEGLYDALLPRP